MDRLKRIDIVLAIVLITVKLLFSSKYVSAATVVDSGSCGATLSYSLYDDGVLDNKGSGKLSYYIPWDDYKEIIRIVKLPDGLLNLYGFSDCENITSISIPTSVTKILDYAFSGCTSLKSVTIPSGVSEIAIGTFAGCSSLTDIKLPNTVEYIGFSAFSDCTSLKSITIPSGVEAIESEAFSGCT